MSKVSVTIEHGSDAIEQARRLSDFLFNRCPGNVAELAVLEYLRRCADQHGRFPWTKHGTLPEVERAIDAVMRVQPSTGTD